MNIKNLRTLLIASLFIIATRSAGQTALTEVCLTPAEYRFYAGCLIDRQVLVKDTARLNWAIRDLSFNVLSLESDLARYRLVEEKMEEKTSILEGQVYGLQNSLDKANTKVVRNRRIAIIGWGIAVLETLTGVVFIYITVTN